MTGNMGKSGKEEHITAPNEDPLEGAKFLHPEKEVTENRYSREPSDYTPRNSFRRRFKELAGIVNGDMINDAIQYGELVQASSGCMAFVLYKPGVTFTFIFEDDKDTVHGWYLVSIWPYVFNEVKAKQSGLWSSKELRRMKEVTEENKEDKGRYQWE